MPGQDDPKGSMSPIRSASPAVSDISELSMLSRTPTPPPELALRLSPRSTTPAKKPSRAYKRDDNRFISHSSKHSAYQAPTTRSSKKQKIREKNKMERKPQDNSLANYFRVRKASNTQIAQAGVGTGMLIRLPLEIRQIIYAYVVDIKEAVCVKECCGPASTKREREACKKHGDHCKKVGRYNGIYEGPREQHYGRFCIMFVSHEIKEEVSWVLFNQGNLLMRIDECFASYLTGSRPTTSVRLQDLPNNQHAKNMWLTAARFRNVRIEIPPVTLTSGNPLVYTIRLDEAVSLLLKAWEAQTNKPTLKTPHTVVIHLGDLYNEIIPFNTSTYPEDVSVRMLIQYPLHNPALEIVAEGPAHHLDRLIARVGRHCGDSKWTVTAKAVSQEGDEVKEGALWLIRLAEGCQEYSVGFEETG